MTKDGQNKRNLDSAVCEFFIIAFIHTHGDLSRTLMYIYYSIVAGHRHRRRLFRRIIIMRKSVHTYI